jgi:hypothetical protein
MDIIQKQLAFFFRDSFKGSFEELSLNIKKKLGDSESTQYIPIFPNAPLEIPRLVLRYKDYALNLSINRADILVTNVTTLDHMKSVIDDLMTVLTDTYKININRIGFVQKSFFESNIGKLLDLIVEKEKYSSAKELSIRINFPKEINKYSCNNIESLNFVLANKLENGKQVSVPGILIERDMNTLPEKCSEYLFTKENIHDLISEIAKEIKDSILLKL